MKKVCVNRLKTDVDRLQQFVNSMEHQEETLEQLFQCLLKLFENEVAHGNPNSVLGHMNPKHGGLLNSQSSSMFNSNKGQNISGLDSVGMSFGKATDDGVHVKPFKVMADNLTGQKDNALVNMNRQYKSDRMVFASRPSNNNSKATTKRQERLLTPLQELESEFVQMGELLRDSADQKEFKARMTQFPLKVNLEQQSSPRFNQSPVSKTGVEIPNIDAFSYHPHKGSLDSLAARDDHTNEQNLWSGTQNNNQRNALVSPAANEEECLQETPCLKNERSSKVPDDRYHVSPTQAYGIPAYSPQKAPIFKNVLQDSYESINTSKLLGNLPGMQTSQSILRASRQAAGNGRSFKEVMKLFLQMMVEDIWTYYEGFSWQKKVLLQSEEKKKRNTILKAQQQNQPHKSSNPSKNANRQLSSPSRKLTSQTANINHDQGTLLQSTKGENRWNGLKTAVSLECPHESKVSHQSRMEMSAAHEFKSQADSSSDSFPPSHDSDSPIQRLNQVKDRPISRPNQRIVGHRIEGQCQLDLSKKSSMVSDYKMDFIDPNKKTTSTKRGVPAQNRNNHTNNTGTSLTNQQQYRTQVTNDFCQSRLIELAPNHQNGGTQQIRSARYGGGVTQSSTNYGGQIENNNANVNTNNHMQQQPQIYDQTYAQQEDQIPISALQGYPVAQSQARERGFIFTEDQEQHGVKPNKSEENLINRRKTFQQPSDDNTGDQVDDNYDNTRGPYLEMGQGKQQQCLTRQNEANGLLQRDLNDNVSRDAPTLIEREMLMRNLRHEMKLSLTTNSLVSPADLELASENEGIEMSPESTTVGNQHVNVMHSQPIITDPNQIQLVMDTPETQKQQLLVNKDGPNQQKEMSAEMTRRLFQNVCAIEKDLCLVPNVSNRIGIIPEDEAEECELSDTFKTLREKNQHQLLLASENDSPAFPNRDSNDEVHKARQMVNMHFVKPSIGSDQRFEDCHIDYSANPFGNQSRQYIDDMTSSSGQLSGMSENADCFPMVESMTIGEQSRPRFSEANTTNANFNVMGQQTPGHQKPEQLTLQRQQTGLSEDQVPRPNRSSTAHEHASTMVREVTDKDYEQQIVLTDKTRKQHYHGDEEPEDHQILSPSRRDRSFKDDRTTERKNSSRKKLVSKQLHLMVPASGQVERSISHRQMQVKRPPPFVGQNGQQAVGSNVPLQTVQAESMRRDQQAQSVLLQENNNQPSSLDTETHSQVTRGTKTQYETADQVVSNYQNLNFMPQKNEGRDRLEVLKQSREFNPVIEFDINSPYSSQRTSQLKMGSSRSNSDVNNNFLTTSLNLTNSQSQPQTISAAAAKDNTKVMPFLHSLPAQPQQNHHQQQFILSKQQDQAAAILEPTQPQQKASTSRNSGPASITNNQSKSGTTSSKEPNNLSQQEQMSLPPFSPQTLYSKTNQKLNSAKALSKLNSGKNMISQQQVPFQQGKNSEKYMALKQHNLNKKIMMQTDQNKMGGNKKLQNLSAQAAHERNTTSAGKEVGANNNNTTTQAAAVHQTNKESKQVVTQFEYRSANVTTGTALSSSNQTPKTLKNGKQFSKQYQSLSNTINQGLNGSKSQKKQQAHK